VEQQNISRVEKIKSVQLPLPRQGQLGTARLSSQQAILHGRVHILSFRVMSLEGSRKSDIYEKMLAEEGPSPYQNPYPQIDEEFQA
jgi:hypothetical protein